MSIRRVTTLFTVKLVLDDFAAAVQQKETAGALAREMRQSSDDLTKYARLYAQTKSARFKDIYNAIVDIRAGKIDRPQDYSATYWAKPPQDVKAALAKTGQKIALIELMKQNGFTDRELNLLAEANKKSNVLAEREAIAFAALEGKGAGSRGKRRKLTRIVFFPMQRIFPPKQRSRIRLTSLTRFYANARKRITKRSGIGFVSYWRCSPPRLSYS